MQVNQYGTNYSNPAFGALSITDNAQKLIVKRLNLKDAEYSIKNLKQLQSDLAESPVLVDIYTDNFEINLANSMFKDMPISNDDYDLYSSDTFILGDATRELLLENGIWYNNTYNNTNESGNWIIRGGNITENLKGIYSFGTSSDINSEYITTRIIIK